MQVFRISTIFPLLALGALLPSCGDKDNGSDGDNEHTGQIGEGDSDTDADADTDTDTDADADTDADSDTDSDTDTDVEPTEDCDDNIDNDDDGLADCDDKDCAASCPETECYNGSDDDLDGDADCKDSDCADLCVEDCRDEFDNDQDGKTDCDDGDCVDVCLEDCNDSVDNDGDGYADCDDDECLGDRNCPVLYDISASLYLDFVSMSANSGVRALVGYGAVGAVYGDITLSGTPVGAGSAFSCVGTVFAGASALGYSGMDYAYKGGCPTCEFAFDFAPKASTGAIVWTGSCPVKTLPSVTLGMGRGDYDIARYDGGWLDAYTAYEHFYSRSSKYGYGYWFYAPSNGGSIDWQGYY